MKLLGLLFAAALADLTFTKCPVGTVQGVSAEDCYYFAASPTTWLQVRTSGKGKECVR